MKGVVAFVVFVCSIMCVVGDIQKPCLGTIGGFKYDLNQLYDATNKAEQVVVDGNSNTYYYAPCHKPTEMQCVFEYDTEPAMCQKDDRQPVNLYHGLGTLGQTNWTQIPAGADKGFHVWFQKNGEADPGPPRMSDVLYTCVEGSGVGKLEFVDEDPTHDYHFKWDTQYACPTGSDGDGGDGDGGSDGISGGWIFIIILICVIFLYIVIGCLVKKFYFGAEKLDIIPNVNFWKALPGLVVDGHRFLFGLCIPQCKRGEYDTM